MRENHIRILCSVLKVDLVFEDEEGRRMAFFDATQDSPLMHSDELMALLRNGIAGQKAPFLHADEFDCMYAAIHADTGMLCLGPMCHIKLSSVRLRQMAKRYGMESGDMRVLPVFTLPEIRNMVLLTNTVLENASLENEELLQLNRIIARNEHDFKKDQTQFLLQEEEANDDDAFRHSYFEEQLLMKAVREGQADRAVQLAESMDRDTGRLGHDDISHHRNLAIVGITLCARAAIDGGLSPGEAYRVSGYYINKCDEAQNAVYLLHYRNRAIEDLSGRVAELQNKPRGSRYVERCMDYVRKHYREKIYLEDIAETLGITPAYLSRTFKSETGKNLQDAINEERVYRASNLLLYSDLSLPEIAQYVHFPNQSYFGKIFKQVKGMTPGAFRDMNRSSEAEIKQ